MVEAVGCHVLNAVTLVLRSDYTLCSSVTPACPARNVLPVRVPRALPLLLQTPLWSMTCHAKSAALCCGEYLDCRIVSFRPYFFFLWSCAGRATLWLYYLLYVTCTHRQCKSSLNNSKDVKWHEWNSLLAFLQKTCLTPQISSTKYQEKCFERDADPDNLLTLMSPWFSRLKQTYEQLQNKFWKLVFWDCNSFTVTAKYFTNTAFWDSDFEFQLFFRTFYSDIFILLKYKKKFCAFSKSLWYISLVFPALPRMEKSQLGPSAEH